MNLEELRNTTKENEINILRERLHDSKNDYEALKKFMKKMMEK